MSHIRVLVCRVDDPSSDTMTELASFDLPAPDVTALQPETALDQQGNRILMVRSILGGLQLGRGGAAGRRTTPA